jgi:hypothetical protein
VSISIISLSLIVSCVSAQRVWINN